MSRAVLRNGSDTHARSDRASAEFGGASRIRLQMSESYGFIWFQVSPPATRGSSVSSATLRLHQIGAWVGSTTISARLVDARWTSSHLNWNNMPGVTGSTASVTQSGTKDGDVWELDVTDHVQSVVSGAPNVGWRLVISDSTARFFTAFNGRGPKPSLEIEWSDAPAPPTTLSPSGGAVSVSHPVLSFDYHDVAGDDAMTALQAQISTSSNFASPTFDTGEWATSVPELRLADTGYAGVSLGATVWWRMRAKNAAGKWSTYSDPVSFSRSAKPTLALTSPAPAPNNFVSEATPPIVWTSAGQVFYQVRLANAKDPGTFILDTGKIKSTATSYTLPKGLIDDNQSYLVIVRIWDNVNRVGTSGDPTYTKVWQEFFFDFDPTIDPAVNIDATQTGAAPWVQLHWTRATAPDGWTVVRDGKVIASDLTPAETTDGGTAYTWTDYTAAPNHEHAYRVAAQVNGKASKGGPTFDYTPTLFGVWLVDPDDGTQVCIFDEQFSGFTNGEDAALYTPIGARAVVRVTSSLRGLEGEVRGVLYGAPDGLSAVESEAVLNSLKEDPARIVRLVIPGGNIPVVLGNVTVSGSQRSTNERPIFDASFNFWQQGELPFSARL